VPDLQLINRLIEAQIATDNDGDMQEKRLLGQRMLAKLNEGQRTAFNEIMASVKDVNNLYPRLFFLDGPGGTGKTFLYNTLIAVLQGQGKSVVAVASTGIAATLLTDGTTYHSKYKLYPPITETTRSKIEENSYSASVIREASLNISDEATMKLNYALDGINHLFQMVDKNRNQPFGNKVLLLGGDFRQCLPVVRHGDRVQVVESTIKNNVTWPLFRQLRLVQNMRTTQGSQEYADWLIQLGNGTLPQLPSLNDPELIEIPSDFLDVPFNLVHHVFGHPSQLLNPEVAEKISTRAILCPKNVDCLRINNDVIANMHGVLKVYRSIDTIDSEDPGEIADYPPEVLNTFIFI